MISVDGTPVSTWVDVADAIAESSGDTIAVEVVRSGNVVGLNLPHLADNAFDGFVVDRLQDGQRLYLRPKVPFGA